VQAIVIKVMKNLIFKTSLLLFMAMVGYSSMAQDVILKKDGSEIKAKVLEITEQQVIKYKEFSFQSGPTRSISIFDVFMITYENGKKEVFSAQTSTPTQRTNNTPSSALQAQFNIIGNDDDMMLDFFKKNNFTNYYNDFNDACSKRRRGKVLLGIGLGLTGVGIIAYAAAIEIASASYDNSYGYNYDDSNDETIALLIVGGAASMTVGQVLTLVSIPVSAVGGAKKKAIKNNFVKEHFDSNRYTYQPKLDFGLTANGVGLTLNF